MIFSPEINEDERVFISGENTMGGFPDICQKVGSQMKRSSMTQAIKETQKQQIQLIGIVLIGLVVVIAIIFSVQSFNAKTPTVPSLSDNWEFLETNAHNAQFDSYLTSVTIDVNKKDLFQFSAEYYSASRPNLLLFIGIDHSNKVTVRPIENPLLAKSAHTIPIKRNDWIIDSQDAFNLFIKDEQVNSCLNLLGGAIELTLYNMEIGKGQVPVWELTLWDCPEKAEVKYLYLNANTGERFDPFTQ